MLAEDDEVHVMLIIRPLQDAGVENKIYYATDREEALDYLFRHGIYAEETKSPRPDLILLDLRMPKLDGLEVLKKIKEADDLKNISVVILITSENEINIEKAYEV